MRSPFGRIFLILFCALFIACSHNPKPAQETAPPQEAAPAPEAPAPQLQLAPDISDRLKKLPDTVIDYDHSLLTDQDRKVVEKLIEASKYLDQIYYEQVSHANPTLEARLTAEAANSDQYRQALKLFHVMKGRWDRLDLNSPFIGPFGDAGKKPAGAGFYPTDITKQQFEQWIQDHPEDKEQFQGLFTVIHRQGANLVWRPYSVEYADPLQKASAALKEAAGMSNNASLTNYLNKLSEALLKDNYYDSDVAWMDLDSPIEVVMGPYEVYEDDLFNYKASFESFITVVDKPESEKLASYAQHLSDMEKNLPIPDEYKNPNRGSDSPIKVVQELYTAGDARRGVQTAAFNLPNDEKVRQAKGAKKVLLKNVMEAKFKIAGDPIARRVLDPSLVPLLSFDAFFNQVLFHELSHSLGPGIITGPDGKKTEYRIYLKELGGTIEECKADVLGVWNILYSIDHGLITSFDRKKLHATYAGLMFRSMRFGIDEAHGQGTAIQWNWMREKGAIIPTSGGHFTVDFDKVDDAYKSLANELLMIEATGDYDRAKRLIDKYGVVTPEISEVNARLKDIPVDISPVFPAAGEKL